MINIKRTAFLAAICLILASLTAQTGLSAPDLTATAKVNISADSIKEIVSALRPVIPIPLDFKGTEYVQGEQATPFLQLKDQQGNAVINGSCKVDIFYPNKTQAVNDAPMLYIPNSDGLYFYTYTPPAGTIGLYPMSAECTYSNVIRWYYTTAGYNPFSQYGIDCGTELINMTTHSGTTSTTSAIVLNTPTDWQYVTTAASSGGTKVINATFSFNTSDNNCRINKTREPNMNVFYMGEASAKAVMTIYIWNWNTSVWDTMSNFTQVGLATTTATSGSTDFASASLHTQNYTNNNGVVNLMAYSSLGTVFTVWWDWFGIETIGNGTSLTDLKGSSELHVWNASLFAGSYASLISQINSTQNLTIVPNQLIQLGLLNQINTTQNKSSATDYMPILSAINSTLNLTIYQQLLDMPASVWAYTPRSLTTFGTLVADIWSYAARVLTDVSNIWSSPTRTLTQAVGSSNLTYCGAGNSNITAEDVWTWTNRSLNDFNFSVTAANVNFTAYDKYLCKELKNGVGTLCIAQK